MIVVKLQKVVQFYQLTSKIFLWLYECEHKNGGICVIFAWRIRLSKIIVIDIIKKFVNSHVQL